jgi:hypothetical protein
MMFDASSMRSVVENKRRAVRMKKNSSPILAQVSFVDRISSMQGTTPMRKDYALDERRGIHLAPKKPARFARPHESSPVSRNRESFVHFLPNI